MIGVYIQEGIFLLFNICNKSVYLLYIYCKTTIVFYRFNNAVRLEQIKLYELLISHSNTLLAHEPVTRPLLRLLEECANDIMPLEVEKKLVVLLNQLCVVLMQNMALLDLFFQPNAIGKNK